MTQICLEPMHLGVLLIVVAGAMFVLGMIAGSLHELTKQKPFTGDDK